MTGQDQNSAWSAVANPSACQVSPGTPDYILVPSTVGPLTVSKSVATASVTSQALGNLGGTISLSVAGVSSIPGAKASFLPASISTSGTSALTITTSQNTPPGTYPITIFGNTGSITHSTTLSLVVP